MRALGSWTALLALAACEAPGGEGTEIPVAFDDLRLGFIYATNAIPGSSGYDLYWSPLPPAIQVDPVGFVRLTESGANEWQPSVAGNGRGIAFAREDDGIFVIARSGRIQRISDTRDTTFVDSLPAVSADATRVAWVREDTSKPIGQTGFFESAIWMAGFDGTDPQALNPVAGIVQDAPVFDPDPNQPRIAWSQLDPTSVSPNFGPTAYGIYMFDYTSFSGTFVCQSVDGFTPGAGVLPKPSDNRSYRCFGSHLAWPESNTLVVTQDLLEVDTRTGSLSTILNVVLGALAVQQTGFAITSPRADGFHAPFPISASYSRDDRYLIMMDGLMGSLSGDIPTLSFIVSQYDGSAVYRVKVDGLSASLDDVTTRNFLFSVTTPQIIPFFR